MEFQNHIKFLIKINAVMVILKCDNAGLWCNINRESARENGIILYFVCLGNYFPGFEILVV